MGLQASDIEGLGREVLLRYGKEGVTGVWLWAPVEHWALLWVTVQGIDEAAGRVRQNVCRLLEAFVEEHRAELVHDEGSFFDYQVLIDDEALGAPPIPDEAHRLEAA